MLSYATLTTQPSFIERCRVISTAVVWNAILPTIGVVIAYIVAGVFALFCRKDRLFYVVAARILSMLVSLAILIPIWKTFKYYIFRVLGYQPIDMWAKHIPLFLHAGIYILVCTFLLIVKPSLKRILYWPKVLTAVLLPVSLAFVVQEAVQVSVHRDSSRSVNVPRGHNLPDIILITFDALSAKHLHTYGDERPDSPNFDAVSSNFIVFDQCYANANWTRPGIASILDGARPWTHNADVTIPASSLAERQSLLNILSRAGYDINIVQSNGFADSGHQGLSLSEHKIVLSEADHLFEWLPITKLRSSKLASIYGVPYMIQHLEDNYLRGHEGKNLPYLASADTLLRNSSFDHPLFLWVHSIIPHDSYAAVPPYLGAFDKSSGARIFRTSEAEYGFHRVNDAENDLLRARYDESIMMADDLFGQIIQMLKRENRYDNSLIVVSADHGESFNPIYGGHGGSLLTEELVRIPCLIKPATSFTPHHESRLMEQVDILPTILSYAGLPEPIGLEGHAYPSKADNMPAFSMNRDLQGGEDTLNIAMRDGDWKYVIHIGEWKHPWPQQELYKLSLDPNEKHNLIESQAERANSMRQSVLSELVKHNVSMSEYSH